MVRAEPHLESPSEGWGMVRVEPCLGERRSALSHGAFVGPNTSSWTAIFLFLVFGQPFTYIRVLRCHHRLCLGVGCGGGAGKERSSHVAASVKERNRPELDSCSMPRGS